MLLLFITHKGKKCCCCQFIDQERPVQKKTPLSLLSHSIMVTCGTALFSHLFYKTKYMQIQETILQVHLECEFILF